MTVLSANNLTVKGNFGPILESISLTFGPGELVGLIGPNGSGKTTLLRSLLGLLEPTDGDITLDGRALGTWSRTDIANRLGYLAQGAPCHWPMTVERIVELGRLPHNKSWLTSDAESQNIIENTLRLTGISHLRHRVVTSLSGGERTLVMIARCLVGRAGILLADEPVTGLDPRHQIEIIECLCSRVTENTGVVIVLHDLNLAVQYCTRLILINNGRVAAEGSPTSVLVSENLAQVYGIEAALHEIDGQALVVCKDLRK